ncbi:MAG TPA: hypothetical protein VJV96_10160 [Candidatus Angelobacter sp.]|nr:hypothetical protein [Candidatus Angelobacter sp.]
MENYFYYFSEIENRYLARRGGGLLLSTLDWVLIETWKDAGIPLDAVLRGIDETFDKYERRPVKPKKINSLTYCAQEVLTVAEEMKEATVGSERTQPSTASGLSSSDLGEYFSRNAEQLKNSQGAAQVKAVAQECASVLEELAAGFASGQLPGRLEDLERRMTVLEEKLIAALMVATPEQQLVSLRAEADREIAPYRSKMPAAQIDQLLKQFVHKRLLEQAKMPRLSLFYM